ncbi:MAG: carotenoid biosynthesis protein, partial [Leptolyngbya sp. SIO1D8]|nr:carotenoid biosynthesis protein [Leptolyngbya sp. SIO1D8]
GFPFGEYSYLSGLGYKIAGLVPFTIPLSWFYLGISSYLLARGGLLGSRTSWWRHGIALAIGALLLMSWDFVLDPAMSQTAMPFWYWHTPGAFFGMPYQNFAGWFFTGILFMSVAATFWKGNDYVQGLTRSHLTLPLVIYLANFAFAMMMSLASGIVTPVLLGLAVGATPAVFCWLATPANEAAIPKIPSVKQPQLSMVKVTVTPTSTSD